MASAYQELKTHLETIVDLQASLALLSWDQETQLPPGAAESRARQMATLSRLQHEMFTSDKTAALLDSAADELQGADETSDESSMVRVVRRDYELATKLPAAFVAEVTRETALAHNIWTEARANNDFKKFLPALERIIELKRQEADYLGYAETPYDALLDQYERGMTTAQVKAIFDAHRPALVELIAAVSEAQQVDDTVLHRPFDINKQRDFGLKMIAAYGFDFQRGVQAISVHPFCTSFSVNDVRITTRFEENFLNPALFGMMHEAGHGMYEQGIGQNLEGTPLAGGTSLGVHESQSRMWENIVGRSREFWSWALPQLREVFPQQLDGVTLDGFYKAINKVERSFIRVEADEATYNLHIILRFELEQDLLNGTLKAADLPEAWNSKFNAFFGITPPTDTLGVLQDVHWSAGLVGYFPTYALGNLLSVQYYNQALKDHPSIPQEISEGKFDTLRRWLNDNIHQHGRKFTAAELTERITGTQIDPAPYMQYLQTKFSAVYGL